ncbi:protein kinase [candidate division KSB1 bacterium]|nr:protein kinase [bacterium]NUM64309.1 protein kinase [candidate division KSB1 bacterium]
MIGQTISHYKIIEKLGGGGMGVVYKAEDTKLKRLVALKFLPPELTRDEEAKERFIHEAQAAAALDHPNICDIHEIGETEEGQLFIVMAYYAGETLKKQMARGKLQVAEVIDIAIQVAQGLAKAHEHGMTHRDIKPANIMVTSEGAAKIVDFGLAKLAGQVQLTKAGTTLGTAAYMSPEQTHGQDVDHRADIWAFGVVLYEMLTGQLPFKGEYEQAIIYSILNETPHPIASLRANVPPELERIVNLCLAKKATDRYQQMTELLADLRALKQSLEYGASQRSLAGSAQPPRKLAYLYGAGVVVLALLVGYVVFIPKTPTIDRKSIAVLPFSNLSESKEDEYFSDGITEDVITQLTKIADLKVISRTSVMQYKGVDKNIPDIGKKLDVATVLEGSVRRAGNQVRIAAQLIDTHDEGLLWAETYDKEMADIFVIQSEIAVQIAMALKVKLSSPEKKQIEKKPTGNITAYDYYLKGREYYYRHYREAYEMAGGFFVKALELDSTFALAYAGLADVCAQRESADSAITLSRRAIAMDARLPEAYRSLGLAYYYKGWMQKSLEASLHAIRLNANHFPAIVNVGWVLIETNPVEALPWFKKAFMLDPTTATSASAIGTAYMVLGDEANAEKWFKQSIEIAPDYWRNYLKLWQLYSRGGRYDAAKEIEQKLLANAPNYLQATGLSYLLDHNYVQAKEYYEKTVSIDPKFRSLDLAYFYKKTGKEGEAQKIFDLFTKRCQANIERGNERYWPRYDMARISAALNRKAEAYEWLQKAIDAGWIEYRWGMTDPLLENLHNDKRFRQMMAHVKAKVDQMRQQVEMMEQR